MKRYAIKMKVEVEKKQRMCKNVFMEGVCKLQDNDSLYNKGTICLVNKRMGWFFKHGRTNRYH